MKHLEVVAAILEYDGKILCMERGQGKFEVNCKMNLNR